MNVNIGISLVLGIFLSLLVARRAEKLGYGFYKYFFLSFIISPLLSWLIVEFFPSKLRVTLLIVFFGIMGAIGIIAYGAGDYTTYANFPQAKQKGRSVNVVGYLVKDKELVYDPQKDPNFFSFIMTDKEGNECKVIYKGAKPQDFERSEQLVVKGNMSGEVFSCSEISMKCPSKYVNDEITLKETNVTVKAGS